MGGATVSGRGLGVIREQDNGYGGLVGGQDGRNYSAPSLIA